MAQKSVNPLQKIKNELVDLLKSQESMIFSPSALRQIFETCRAEWGLPKSVTFSRFCDFLIDEIGFKVEKCSFPYRSYTRYTMGEVPFNSLLLSLVPDAYLSHFTALDLHGLTESVPDRVYLNYGVRNRTRQGDEQRLTSAVPPMPAVPATAGLGVH